MAAVNVNQNKTKRKLKLSFSFKKKAKSAKKAVEKKAFQVDEQVAKALAKKQQATVLEKLKTAADQYRMFYQLTLGSLFRDDSSREQTYEKSEISLDKEQRFTKHPADPD